MIADTLSMNKSRSGKYRSGFLCGIYISDDFKLYFPD